MTGRQRFYLLTIHLLWSVCLFAPQVNTANGSRAEPTDQQPVGTSETVVRLLEPGQTIR